MWTLKSGSFSSNQQSIIDAVKAGNPVHVAGGLRVNKRLAVLYGALQGVLDGVYDRVAIIAFRNSMYYFRETINELIDDSSFDKMLNDGTITWHVWAGREYLGSDEKTCVIVDSIEYAKTLKSLEYPILVAENGTVVHYIENTWSHKSADWHGEDDSVQGQFFKALNTAGWTHIFVDENDIDPELTQLSKDYAVNREPDPSGDALTGVDLSVTTSATNVTVLNNAGDDATIPAATQTSAGVMSADDKTKLDNLSSSFLGVFSELSDLEGIHPTGQAGQWAIIEDSDGGSDFCAWDSDTNSWSLTDADSIKGETNLSLDQTANDVTVKSDTGADVVIPSVDSTNAGVMSSADKTKLDGIEENAKDDQNAAEVPFTPTGDISATNVQLAIQETYNESLQNVDLSLTRNASEVTVTNSGGQDVVIPSADDTNAGVMSSADKTKLDGIEENAKDDQNASEVPANEIYPHSGTNVQDNLQFLFNHKFGAVEYQVDPDNDSVDVTTKLLDAAHGHQVSQAGFSIQAATQSVAGVLVAADKTKLDAIEAGATADQNASEVPFTPAGDIAATDVQAAIEETYTELDTKIASNATSINTNSALIATNTTNITANTTKLDGIESGATADQNAAEVPFTPAGSIASTNVQAAIEELDGDIQNIQGSTNLGYTPAVDHGVVTSDTGNDATLPLVDGTNAGLISPSQNSQIDTNEADISQLQTDLQTEQTARSDADTNLQNQIADNDSDIATLQLNKLEHVNLGYSQGSTNGTITNDAGNDAVIPGASDTNAGLLSADDKVKLDKFAPIDNVPGSHITDQYTISRGFGIITNSTGLLRNNYNFTQLTYDPVITPNVPGSFRHDGYSATIRSDELMAIDPNLVYDLSILYRQESVPGDWSAYPYEDRHRQYAFIDMFDIDGYLIVSSHHMRYKYNGVDSLTTLTQPFGPGDTVMHVTDVSGWNQSGDASLPWYRRSAKIMEYKNSLGYKYKWYSRIISSTFTYVPDTGVDTANNTITFETGMPSSMANPDDPNGVWPAGTRVCGMQAGGTYKYVMMSGVVPSETDKWLRANSMIGGIDISGENYTYNFSPGTAFVKLGWLPNYTNRSGGYSSNWPDTGPDQSVWFSSMKIEPNNLAKKQYDSVGKVLLYRPVEDSNGHMIMTQFTGQSVNLEV
jgi:hypothetical protein